MVARRMYQMRFPEEDVSRLTMQQLRGREGSRIRQVYRACAWQWGVAWNGRTYQPDDFFASDPVNQAHSAGHACLYGVAHAVIAALGCAPGLGFIHVGHENSFVYDIADLYKAETTIPAAFEIAADPPPHLGSATRRLVRDKHMEAHILERMVAQLVRQMPIQRFRTLQRPAKQPINRQRSSAPPCRRGVDRPPNLHLPNHKPRGSAESHRRFPIPYGRPWMPCL